MEKPLLWKFFFFIYAKLYFLFKKPLMSVEKILLVFSQKKINKQKVTPFCLVDRKKNIDEDEEEWKRAKRR